jgi:hypothetical protein
MARMLAVTLTVLAMFYVASSAWGLAHRGEIGFTYTDEGLVTSVKPGGAAARAGISTGDRIDLARTPQASRVALDGNNVAGRRLDLAFDTQRGSRVATLVLDRAPLVDYVSWLKRPIAALLCLLAGALVFWRPQRATWAFFIYALLVTLVYCSQYWAFPLVLLYVVASAAAQTLLGCALLYFAVAFLHAEPRRWHTPVVLVAVAVSVTLSVVNAITAAAQTLHGDPVVGVGSKLAPISASWVVIQTLGTLAILIEAYVTGRRSHRQRIAWVVVGIGYAVVFQVFLAAFVDLSYRAVAQHATSAIAYALFVLSPLAVAVAVVYAMTQYRVVDVRFAINRALVYAVTTTALVGIFALVEWAASRLFEGSQVEVYAGIAAALLLGFTLNAFHKRIDDVLDFFFFQRERKAAGRLKHLAASLPYADDEETVVQFLVREPARALELASAAVFLSQEDGTLRLSEGVGWEDCAPAILRNDPLIPQLRAGTEPLALRDVGWRVDGLPSGVLEPLFALPIKARADLFGIVFYGGHTNGATLNPDERALLGTLVAGAASAFDHIEAARAREQIVRLTAEVHVLSRLGART